MTATPVSRLLYVEDDESVRLLIADALRDEGFHLDIAENVANALALLATAFYDLILTDGRLPDGTGLDIAERAAECWYAGAALHWLRTRIFPVTSRRDSGYPKTVEDSRINSTYSSGARRVINDNSPFKGFRMETIEWPENVIDLCETDHDFPVTND